MDNMGSRAVPQMLFQGNLANNWKIWRQLFENYLIASETYLKEQKVQCARLIHYIGEEALHIYNSFTFTEAERDKVDILIKKFEEYFTPRTNVIYERYKFFNMKQDQLSIEKFTTDLKNQAKLCKLKQMEEELIVSVLISGTNDSILREQLLEKQEEKLTPVTQFCQVWEASKMQSLEMRQANVQQGQINVVRKQVRSTVANQQGSLSTSHNLKRTDQTFRSSAGTTMKSKLKQGKVINNCNNCGQTHAIRQCPAYGEICFNCNKKNHFSYRCRTSSNTLNKFHHNKKINVINTDNYEERNSDLCIDVINFQKSKTKKSWLIDLDIHSKKLSCKVDTGADANILSIEIFKKLCLSNNLNTCRDKLYNYTNQIIPIVGKVNIKCKFNYKEYDICFYVTEGNYNTILGLQACEMLGLVQGCPT